MLLQSVQSGTFTDKQLTYTSRLAECRISVIALCVLTLRVKLSLRVQANMAICFSKSRASVKNKSTESAKKFCTITIFLNLVSYGKEQPYKFIYYVYATVLVLLNKVYLFSCRYIKRFYGSDFEAIPPMILNLDMRSFEIELQHFYDLRSIQHL